MKGSAAVQAQTCWVVFPGEFPVDDQNAQDEAR